MPNTSAALGGCFLGLPLEVLTTLQNTKNGIIQALAQLECVPSGAILPFAASGPHKKHTHCLQQTTDPKVSPI